MFILTSIFGHQMGVGVVAFNDLSHRMEVASIHPLFLTQVSRKTCVNPLGSCTHQRATLLEEEREGGRERVRKETSNV